MLAGVDGWKRGWIAAILHHAGTTFVRTFQNFQELHNDPDLEMIIIDVPIGLPEMGARSCDKEARKELGRHRGSSIFPAPIRSMLLAGDWEEACRIRRDREGKKCSNQVAAILPKIREVDEMMTPELQSRIREGHPELSFYMLNDRTPLVLPKRRARATRAA